MSVVDTQEELVGDVAETFEEAGLMSPTPQSKEFDEAFDDVPKGDPVSSEQDEDDFRARIWNAEQDCRRRELQVEIAKDDLKAAKAEYDGAVERLRKIANEGSQPSLFDPPKKAKPEPEPLPEPSNAWRERPFMPWLETAGLKGIGVNKKEALYEVVETFGAFEDLRVQAQKENVHLCKLLPKGFGEGIVDAIVEAFLVAKDEPYIDRMQPLVVISDKMPAAQRKELEGKWRDYSKIIRDENEIDAMVLADCRSAECDSIELQDGFDAFEDGLAVHACDADTIDGQSDWVYGWCLAQRKEQLMIAADKATEGES